MDLSLQRQIIAIFAVSMSSLMISFSLGFSSPAVSLIEKDPSIHMTSEDASWIASAVPGAALISTIIVGPLVETVGRKFLMVFSSIIFFLSWLGIERANNIDDLIGYRALCGIAVGAQAVVASVYQSEIINDNMKGKLAMVPAFIGNIGMLMAFASGELLDWREIARFGCYLSVPLLIYIYLPETPYFLIATRKRSEAFKVLTWLRGNELLAIDEIKEQEMHQDSKRMRRVGIVEAFEPPHRWGVSMAIFLHIGQQATGIMAITIYSTQIFEQLGSSLNPVTCSIILQIVSFCGFILQIIIVARNNRRYLMHCSSIIVIFSLFALCVYLCILNFGKFIGILGKEPNIIIGLFPLLILSVYVIGFNIGWGPVPWVFLVECLSSGSRGTGTSLAIATNWISTFVVTKTFLYLMESNGIFFVFLLYMLFTTIFLAIVHFCMPESANIKPKDIDQIYLDSYIKTNIVVNSC